MRIRHHVQKSTTPKIPVAFALFGYVKNWDCLIRWRRSIFSKEYRATAEFRAISPLGKVPVLFDGDIRILESGAMVQYVLERYAPDKLKPANDDPLFASYLQWMWFAEATAARPLGEIVNHTREFPDENRIAPVVDENGQTSCRLFNSYCEPRTRQTVYARRHI